MEINSNRCFQACFETVNCYCNKERPLPVMLEIGSILAQERRKYHDIVV